jgi:hypothetical protein
MIIRVFLYWNWKGKKVEQCSPTITWTSTKRTTHNSSNKNNHLYDQFNGHPDRAWNRHLCFDIFCFVPFRYIRFAKLRSLPVFVYISFCFVPFHFVSVNFVTFHFVLVNFITFHFASFRFGIFRFAFHFTFYRYLN